MATGYFFIYLFLPEEKCFGIETVVVGGEGGGDNISYTRASN